MLWPEHVLVGCVINYFRRCGHRDAWWKVVVGSILPDLPMFLLVCVLKYHGLSWDEPGVTEAWYSRIFFFWPHSFLALFFIHADYRVYYAAHILCDVPSHRGMWSIQMLYPLSSTSMDGVYEPWRIVCG